MFLLNLDSIQTKIFRKQQKIMLHVAKKCSKKEAELKELRIVMFKPSIHQNPSGQMLNLPTKLLYVVRFICISSNS